MINFYTTEPESIPLNRVPWTKLDPLTEETPLVLSIQAKGQLIPVLVDGNQTLIDGFERLRVLTMLGEKVNVVQCDTYEELCNTLRETRLEAINRKFRGNWSPMRIYQIYRSLAAARKAQISQDRRLSRRKDWQGGELPKIGDLLQEAVGISESERDNIQNIYGRAYGAANDCQQLALELVRRVDGGEFTLNRAVKHLQNYRRGMTPFNGTVLNPEEQRTILTKGAPAINGVLKTLMTLGPLDERLTPEELTKLLREYKKLRGLIYRFVKALEGQSS